MPQLTYLNQKASKILEKLVDGVDYDNAKRVNNAPGVYMYVSVNQVAENQFSVAHYYEQNGDLCQDPDVVFLKSPSGRWFPIMFQQANPPVYQEPVEFDEDGTIKGWRPRMLRDLVSFCNQWMENIEEQQGGDLSGKVPPEPVELTG